MRCNIYAEEMIERVELVSKTVNGETYTGVRFYVGFPFKYGQIDDDLSAVTFWGKRNLRVVLRIALDLLDQYYDAKSPKEARAGCTENACHTNIVPGGNEGISPEGIPIPYSE